MRWGRQGCGKKPPLWPGVRPSRHAREVPVGRWVPHPHAVPPTDIYSFTMRGAPWISTQWLAQVLYAEVYAWFGWTGPGVLARAAIASALALLARFLRRYFRRSTTLVFVGS